MSADKHTSDTEISDLSEKSLSDAAAEKVKGGAAPRPGPSLTPPIPKIPGIPRVIEPCW